MIKVKKIEFIIRKPHLSKFLEILDKQNISGYTIIDNVMGKGSKGDMTWNEITDSFKNVYIFTLCEEEKAQEIIDNLYPFFKKYGGIYFLTDSYIIEKNY